MEIKPLPKWIMNVYSKLWSQFKDKGFRFKEAIKVLNLEKSKVSVFISELKKRGWVTVKLSEKDARKRIYKLIKPNDAISKISK